MYSWRKPDGEKPLEKPGVDARIILKIISENRISKWGSDSFGWSQKSVMDSCEQDTEPSVFITGGVFVGNYETTYF